MSDRNSKLVHTRSFLLQEFKLCLQTAELSLTRKDVNLLMAKVDVDGDGSINYNEFVPICFGILVERFADQVMSSSALSSEDGISVAILRYFKEQDVEGMPICCRILLTTVYR